MNARKNTMSPTNPEASLDDAMRALRSWYYTEIKNLADRAIEAIVGRVVADPDAPRRPSVLGHLVGIECSPDADRGEFLDRWIDGELEGPPSPDGKRGGEYGSGHEFLYISSCTRAALLASSNSDAWEEDNGEDAVADEPTRCAAAMRADLLQLLEARRDEWERKVPTVDELRKLATIELRWERDLTPVRGNALASGDDAEDKVQEDEIIARLDRGDDWAWCCVTVTAEYYGCTGRDTLGGCSYKSEAEFRADPYFADMVNTALEDLHRQLSEVA